VTIWSHPVRSRVTDDRADTDGSRLDIALAGVRTIARLTARSELTVFPLAPDKDRGAQELIVAWRLSGSLKGRGPVREHLPADDFS
jgi:hypothetical protein